MAAYLSGGLIDSVLHTGRSSPGGQAMKQHEFRELVNELRDTAIKYHASQELRERIVHVLWAYEVFPDALPHQRQAPEAKP